MQNFATMVDQFQEIVEEQAIENNPWSTTTTAVDDDSFALLNDIVDIDAIDIFGDTISPLDYDEDLNPTIVSASSCDLSDPGEPIGLRRNNSADLMHLLLCPSESQHPGSSWGHDSGLTAEFIPEESPVSLPTTQEPPLEFPPMEPAPYAQSSQLPPPALDSNTLINLTFPSDTHPPLPLQYDSSSWGYDCPPALIAVSPGPEEAEDEATVSPPPKLNRCVTPPVVVSKTRSSSSLKTKSSPPDQGIVTPPRGTMKRKKAPKIRAPRKKEPNTKHYVTMTQSDVLLGRGGCSNHHSGNTEYRERILKLQPVYKRLLREEKTQFSQDVVNWVKQRGGRFLKRDERTSPWYIATDQMARLKVSQALREDHSPAGRKAKKAKQARAGRTRNDLD